MSVGTLPGFRPALDDFLAPIKNLQLIYVEYYGLKKYPPVIMQPDHFLMDAQSPIYYSLQYPTILEFTPKNAMRNSALTDLYLANSLLNKFLEELDVWKSNIHITPLEEVPEKVNFDFFHNNVELYKDIKESSVIPMEDNAFVDAYQNTKDRTFPKNSTFLNGCIRISHK